MTHGGRLMSLRGALTVHAMTAGDGPFMVFMSDKSISLAEFEEYLEAGGPVNPDDTVPVERALRGRRIRYLGLLLPTGSGTSAGISLMNHAVSGLKWTRTSQGWQYILYNLGPAMQTGAFFRSAISHFVRWDAQGN